MFGYTVVKCLGLHVRRGEGRGNGISSDLTLLVNVKKGIYIVEEVERNMGCVYMRI